MANEAITVGVRLRPLVAHEQGQQHCVQISGNEVSLTGDHVADDEKQKRYAFDYAMDSSDPKSADYVSQEKCYELMGRRMKEHMATGFNTCLFCYGQTGTGKTTTIMGQAKPVSEQGVLMRFLHEVFIDVEKQKTDGYTVDVEVMMLEVYNEKLNNLLMPEEVAKKGGIQKLEVHVHPVIGVTIKGACPEPVDSFDECLKLIEYGNAMKSVRATAMNKRSSRGHTIFRLNMERSGGTEARKVKSEVYFADLAGRENEKTTQVTGDGRIELTFINKSLHFLAQCIQSLSNELKEKPVRVSRTSSLEQKASPRSSTCTGKAHAQNLGKFRNSKLTLILANALSGNSRTAMIGTLSPSANNLDETISTLKFAATVKTIKLQARAVQAVDKDQVVADLRDEVARLKAELSSKRQSLDYDQKLALQSKLEATESLATFYSEDMNEQRKQALSNKKLREQTLRRVSFDPGGSDAPLPHLLNYCDDRYLAFKLAFHVPADGQEYSAGTKDTNKFRLPPGPGVCSVTCYLSNRDNQLWIRAAPVDDSEKYLTVKGRKFAHIEVNDYQLDDKLHELKHLDKVIFGRSTVFYAFKKKAAQEELELLRTEQEEQECPDENEDGKIIEHLLDKERRSDKLQVGVAEEYLRLMRSHHKDNEGQTALTLFLHKLKISKKLIDEANDITEALRPHSGLVMELSTMAPILGFGYGVTSYPEICARLIRRISPARARWQYAVKCIKNSVTSGRLSMMMAMDFSSQSRENLSQGHSEIIALWTLPTFEARLEVMRDYLDSKNHNSEFELPIDDPSRDPWCVNAPASLKKEAESARHQRINASAVKKNLKKQLEDTVREKQELERQLEAFKAASSEGPTWGVAAELQRCIDLSRTNQKLVEDFVHTQEISREERKANDAKLARLKALNNKWNDHRRCSEAFASEVGVGDRTRYALSSATSTQSGKLDVSILVVLKHEQRKYTLLVSRARMNFTGIPAGSIDSSGRVVGASLEEMEDEIGERVTQSSLLNMTQIARANPSRSGVNTRSDSVFLFRQAVTSQQFQDLQRRFAGMHSSETKVQIVPMEDLWQFSSDSKALSALCLYEKLIASGRLNDF